MIPNFYEAGNTILLFATFANEIGTPQDPSELPIVTIYNKAFQIVDVPMTAKKEDVGKYSVAYEIPFSDTRQIYYYEFKGIIEGSIALNRGQFISEFYVDEVS